MIAERQIREQLARYLRRELSLDEFEDWVVQRSWNMHLDSGDDAQKLASAIELRLAEYSSGHFDEDSLRKDLLPFVTNYTFQISIGGGVPVLPVAPNNVSVSPHAVIQIQQVVFHPTPHPAEAEFAGTLGGAVFG
jgi:hypothetical protein